MTENNTKPDIKSMDLGELTEALKALGEPSFRAKQLYEWMHKKGVSSYDEMSNIPKSLKEKLIENFSFTSLKAVEVKESHIDETKKFLFALHDGNVIESVFMKYKFGVSVCISSQVGCRMGCRFCASTLDGVERNLFPSEMLDQIYAITRITGEKVSRVVVMGSGEPLDNYEEVTAFIRLVTMKEGLNLSRRAVTLSTCGLKAGICRLADSGLDVNLALSLHAPNHELRRQMLPVENANRLEDVMAALDYYRAKTGRRITCEYCLIEGKNDTIKCSEELYELLKNTDHLLNVIGVNDGSVNKRDDGYIYAFADRLRRKGLNVTVRRRLGSSINAACGQLKSRYVNDKEV